MKQNNVTVRHSAEMAALYQIAGLRGKALIDKFPQYSRATIYRHAKKELNGLAPFDRRKKNPGRPRKVTAQDKRAIIRAVPKLREEEGWFTSARVAVQAGVAEKFSNRTVRRVLNGEGFKYCQARKKGLLLHRDLKARKEFCNKVKALKLGPDFWKYHIAFYLDGKGFQFKTNPLDQARAPRARLWRKVSEGLKYGCTAKGQKEGAVNANFMVAISYNHGVVLRDQYFGSITGEKFADIVRDSFPQAFQRSIDPRGKRFLMDGCPRQNCKKAMDAIDEVNAKLFSIPSRSPDLNPIENFFHLINNELRRQVLEENIMKETFESFSARVKETMLNFPIATIDKLIESMAKRIDLVLRSEGMRIKY